MIRSTVRTASLVPSSGRNRSGGTAPSELIPRPLPRSCQSPDQGMLLTRRKNGMVASSVTMLKPARILVVRSHGAFRHQPRDGPPGRSTHPRRDAGGPCVPRPGVCNRRWRHGPADQLPPLRYAGAPAYRGGGYAASSLPPRGAWSVRQVRRRRGAAVPQGESEPSPVASFDATRPSALAAQSICSRPLAGQPPCRCPALGAGRIPRLPGDQPTPVGMRGAHAFLDGGQSLGGRQSPSVPTAK